MSNAPWSISKANLAHECTLRYHLKYKTADRGHRIESSAGRIGTAVHEIIERMLRGEDFRVAFKASAVGKLTQSEMLDLKTFESGIKRFLTMFTEWRTKQGRPEVYQELKVAITEDLRPTGFWEKDAFFRGALDISCVVTKGGEKYAIIIDHKSGDVTDIEKYKPQLDSYVVTAAILYPEIVGAQAAIHWVAAQEAADEKVIVWGPMYKRAEIENTLTPALFAYLETAEQATKGRPTPTEGWYCQFCEYQKTCPLK